jgi:hypothetical protein
MEEKGKMKFPFWDVGKSHGARPLLLAFCSKKLLQQKLRRTSVLSQTLKL